MLILLLYAAGLRIGEALSLRMTDVDLSAGILTIRESKFYKTRLVPMSPALNGTLGEYVAHRAKDHPTPSDAALFLTRTGTPVVRHTAENVFSRLRARAGVQRHDGGRYQPRLHDLRHYAEFRTMPSKLSSALCFRLFLETRLGIVWAASGHGCWSNGNSIRLLL
jgi:integrase